jgi:hypothetical protein
MFSLDKGCPFGSLTMYSIGLVQIKGRICKRKNCDNRSPRESQTRNPPCDCSCSGAVPPSSPNPELAQTGPPQRSGRRPAQDGRKLLGIVALVRLQLPISIDSISPVIAAANLVSVIRRGQQAAAGPGGRGRGAGGGPGAGHHHGGVPPRQDPHVLPYATSSPPLLVYYFPKCKLA